MKTKNRPRHQDNGLVTPPGELTAVMGSWMRTCAKCGDGFIAEKTCPSGGYCMALPVKLDLGCGPNPREGYEGVDRLPFGGKVKHVLELGRDPWPWPDSSVDEVFSSHFLEHLTALERCHAMNELWRVLKPGKWVNGKPEGGFAVFIVPHWASCRAYGDPTHAWPPIGEFWTWYLDKNWRAINAPHADAANNPGMYSCDFEFVNGQTWNPALQARNDEYKQFAMANYKEAIHDLHLNLMARKG